MIKGFKWRDVKTRQEELLKILDGKTSAIVFDTETTGLADEKKGITEDDIKIIQFSGILYDIKRDGNRIKLEQKETLNLYINPGELLPREVVELTGITNEILASADLEELAIWKISRFMSKSNLWIAYNTPYDIKRLQGLRKRTERAVRLSSKEPMNFLLPGEGQGSPITYDVLPMVRDLVDPESIKEYKSQNGIKRKGFYKLDILTPMLLPNLEASFHNSLDDVRSTAMLFEALFPEYMKISLPLGTKKVKVKKFSYDFASPYNMMNTRRIVIYVEPTDTSNGAYAEKIGVYWDVSGSVWSCEANKESKALFKELDLSDLEGQVLALAREQGYIGTNEYQTISMDTLHIEASKRWANTSTGKRKLKLAKKIAEERKLAVKGSELEKLFADIQID